METIKMIMIRSCSRGLILGQRSIAEIWFDNTKIGKEFLGLIIFDTGMNDDVIACSRDSSISGGAVQRCSMFG